MEEIYLYISKVKKENRHAAILWMAEQFSAKKGGAPPRYIARSEHGKPYFPGRDDLFFSVSHSGDFFAVAVSNTNIGIDLQQHRKTNSGAIARRFFQKNEVSFLERYPERFFDIWAAKESYVKYTGEGLARGFSRFSTIDQGDFKEKINDAFLFSISFLSDYSLFLCSEKRLPVLLNCENIPVHFHNISQ